MSTMFAPLLSVCMYSVGEVFCQSNTTSVCQKIITLTANKRLPLKNWTFCTNCHKSSLPGPWKQSDRLRSVAHPQLMVKIIGGVEEEFEHMCESASRCSAQLLSPHCAPVCAGETQAHVETPIKGDTVGWHDGESSITVIAFKQTQVFCPVRLNVWQRQMQTHHSSQDCIWLGWIRRRGNRDF